MAVLTLRALRLRGKCFWIPLVALGLMLSAATSPPGVTPAPAPLPDFTAEAQRAPRGSPIDLPPVEAFDDHPGYHEWRVTATEVGRDGETARIRLRHPENARVVAVLQYRLVGSSVTEAR